MIQPCTPWHESAHGLISHLAGINVLGVSVFDDGDIAGRVDQGRERPDALPDAYELSMMAGYAGELLYDPDPDRAWLHCEGDRAILAAFGHTEAQMRSWAATALDMLREYRPEWHRVAALLAAEHFVGGYAIRDLLDRVPVLA